MATDDVKTVADSSFVTGASDELSMGFDGVGGNITLTAGELAINGATALNLTAGFLTLPPAEVVVISGGAATITCSHVRVAGELAASDNLDTISGGADATFLVLWQDDNAQNITVRDASISGGNINTEGAASFTFDNRSSKMTFIKRATVWDELSRSYNL